MFTATHSFAFSVLCNMDNKHDVTLLLSQDNLSMEISKKTVHKQNKVVYPLFRLLEFSQSIKNLESSAQVPGYWKSDDACGKA
jgi:hypothetical protein